MNPFLHLQLLGRTDRLFALREVIRRTVAPGTRVLDAGCGVGILSVWAAQEGAADVLGIDVESVELATAIAAANGVASLTRFETGDLHSDAVLKVIGQRDLILAMLFLNDPRRDEAQIELALAVRRHCLAEGGIMVPECVVYRARLVNWPEQDLATWRKRVCEKTARLSSLHGLNLSPLAEEVVQGAWHEQFPERTPEGHYIEGACQMMSDSIVASTINYDSGAWHRLEDLDFAASVGGPVNAVVWSQELWWRDILIFCNESVSWIDRPFMVVEEQRVRIALGDEWRRANVVSIRE